MEEPYWVREGDLRCNGPADLDRQPQAEVGRLEPDVLQSDSIHDWMEPERTGSDGFGEAKPQATMPESTCSRQTIRGHGDLREGRLVEGSSGRGGDSLAPWWDHDHSAQFRWDPDPGAQKTGGISRDRGKNTWIPAQIPVTKHCENTMKTLWKLRVY